MRLRLSCWARENRALARHASPYRSGALVVAEWYSLHGPAPLPVLHILHPCGHVPCRLEATSFDAVVTALGSHSTVRLLDASTTTAAEGPGGGGGGDGGAEAIRAAATGVRAAAADVQANVCWSLMLALRKKTGAAAGRSGVDSS